MAEPLLFRAQVALIAQLRKGGCRNDLLHDYARRLQSLDLARVVGSQADRPDTDGLQHRRSIVVAPAVGGQPETKVRVYSVGSGVLLHVRAELVEQADAASFMTGRVDQDAAALSGEHAKSQFELSAAVAAQRAERVPGQALGVHPGQHGLAVTEITLDERQVDKSRPDPEGPRVELPGDSRQLDPSSFAKLAHECSLPPTAEINRVVCSPSQRVGARRARSRTLSHRPALRGYQGTAHACAEGGRGHRQDPLLRYQRRHRTAGLPRGSA